jgi:hypothetical protein
MQFNKKERSVSRLSIFVLLFSFIWVAGCGGGSGTSTPGKNTVTPSGANAAVITAGGRPANITNGLFTTVTVCNPGSTTNCATIGGILVDTGSFGLRILSSALPSGFSLPQQTDGSGNPIGECTVFADGFSWGGIATGDMTIASEKASSMPIQIINGSFGPSIPTSCSSNGAEEDTVATFGANGVIGVGNFAQDCGTACSTSTSPQIYFSCPASGCFSTVEPVASQVVNPVALFTTDNNGVVVELPAITSTQGETSATGTLVFGIGTQSNNGLGSATILTLDVNGNFTTNFLGNAVSGSFVDSGSTDLFFADNAITQCTVGTPPNTFSVYCPSSNVNLTANNQGTNGMNTTINFTITNATQLPAQNFIFNDLGAPAPSTIAGFDWGLPFFFGRNVFVAIAGKSTPGGTGPYTAY